ncbi:AAA family ATPase [Thioalkalivibrio sp. HK1]|uniref:AAA family ATPase n=1 Tax=Thioalkalivibrio sp. HK1 TaxID=1469245 RepID=UPI0004702557|nr:AAA family ATPase [Thioalkalivibrio sp. HK1]
MTTDSEHNEDDITRIDSIKIENYRSLKKIELENLTPLTVLIGPNGSGKSTIFDALEFLSECFLFSLRHAWDKRGRARELKTRGQHEAIKFEIKYREKPRTPLITYHLEIDEEDRGLIVIREWIGWRRKPRGRIFHFLDCKDGEGSIIGGEIPDEIDDSLPIKFHHPDTIAVNTLGTMSDHPRVAALREFILDWYLSCLSIENTRNQPEAGSQKRLSKDGSNLADVIQHLKEQHPERLDRIFSIMRHSIPHLERANADMMTDGRLPLQIKDTPFEHPISAKHASNGTLKMLAYLTLLHDPTPPRFIGIEEPENCLYPHLMYRLGEEFRSASENSQMLITTHSPFLLDAMKPEEVRLVHRDPQGFTKVVPVKDIKDIEVFFENGAPLGNLWTEGYLSSPLQENLRC